MIVFPAESTMFRSRRLALTVGFLAFAALAGQAAAQQPSRPVGAPLRIAPPGSNQSGGIQPGTASSATPRQGGIELAPGPSFLKPVPGSLAVPVDPSTMPSATMPPVIATPPLATPPLALAREPEPDDSGTSIVATPLAAPPPRITGAAPSAADMSAFGGLGSPPQPGSPIGNDLWAGTPRRQAVALVQALPPVVPSAALRDVQRQLLETAFDPPEGPPPEGPGLLQARLTKLVEMGELRAAGSVLQAARQVDEESLLRQRLDLLWLANRTQDGCREVADRFTRYKAAYWQQAQATCLALAGDRTQAQFMTQLLRDQNYDDPAFYILVEMVGGTSGLNIDNAKALSPLDLVLLRAAKRDVPPKLLETLDQRMLRALAFAVDLPAETRLIAADRAAALGAVSARELGDIYLAAFDGAPGDAKTQGKPSLARIRAIAWQAAVNEQNQTLRATIVAGSLKAARTEKTYPLTARLYRPVIEQLRPTADLAFAAEAARALIAADSIEAAQPWISLLRSRIDSEPEAGRALAQIWPLTRLASREAASGSPTDLAEAEAWLTAERRRQPKGFEDRAFASLALLEAGGQAIPPTIWDMIPDQNAAAARTSGSAARLIRLRSAIDAKRIGETVAQALGIAAGPPDLVNATAVVGALRSMSLDGAARAYVAETLASMLAGS